MQRVLTKTTNKNVSSAVPALPIDAIRQIADWMLDLAVRNADGDPEDLGAIKRVRRATHAAIAGRPIRELAERDVIIVASLVVTAAERDLGLDGIGDAVASTFDLMSNQPAPAIPIDCGAGCRATNAYPVRRVATLPMRTCRHRGPLLAPYQRCMP